MKSRITIEVDFDNGNEPIFHIIVKHSDDVRDKLMSSFFERLRHVSEWGKFSYLGHWMEWGDHQNIHRWSISAISPEQLTIESKRIDSALIEYQKLLKSYPKPKTVTEK